MFKADTIAEITSAAIAARIEPAALLAVAEVESGGRAYALVNGRREPLIRFEGHYFDRRLNGVKRDRARDAGLASPVAGRISNPASQSARWQMLERAEAIDRKAAFESVSWGLGQVVGAHWAWLGFARVEAMVTQARANAGGQARLMARYIEKAGLREALEAKDWPRFARGYNGPGYSKTRYDTRLAAAYQRHAKNTPAPASVMENGPLLRRGDKGVAIRDLQIALAAAGYALSADGLFGPMTAAALLKFQHNRGLAEDGIAGPRTLAALRSALSVPNRLTNWWTKVRSMLAALLSRRHV